MKMGRNIGQVKCLSLFCWIAILTVPQLAGADEPCTKQGLEAALQKIEQNLAKPSVQREIKKARADFAADQDFDDIDAALYLDAYALYLREIGLRVRFIEKLADGVGISLLDLDKIESGERLARSDELERIGDTLEIDVDLLVMVPE